MTEGKSIEQASPHLRREEIQLEIQKNNLRIHELSSQIKAMQRSMLPTLDQMTRAQLGNEITVREDQRTRLREENFSLNKELGQINESLKIHN